MPGPSCVPNDSIEWTFNMLSEVFITVIFKMKGIQKYIIVLIIRHKLLLSF